MSNKLQNLPENSIIQNAVNSTPLLLNWYNICWSECALTKYVRPTVTGLQTIAAAFRRQSPEI
jgi:hypothetical protein